MMTLTRGRSRRDRSFGLAALSSVALALCCATTATSQPLGDAAPCEPERPPAGSVDAVEAVTVEAVQEPFLARTTTNAKCGRFAERQQLEAMQSPNSSCQGPRARRGELVGRATFCGTVSSYGVYNERYDPRDILINIVPFAGERGAPFRPFVEPFSKFNCGARCLHTEVTPPEQFFRVDREFLPIDDRSPLLHPCSHGGQRDRRCVSRLEVTGYDLCVFGVYAYDHGSHAPDSHELESPTADHDWPEIHPIDVVWWPRPRGFRFAVFQDDSNRYSDPDCGETNGNRWSQAPIDRLLSFPFEVEVDELPVRVDVRRTRVLNMNGVRSEVQPLNVSTALHAGETEASGVRRIVDEGRVLLEIYESEGHEQETFVTVEGSRAGDALRGTVQVRVAVGCDPDGSLPCDLSALRFASPQALHDESDPGSGFYYGEIVFHRSAAARLQVTVEREGASGENEDAPLELRLDGDLLADLAQSSSLGPFELEPGRHRLSVSRAAGLVAEELRAEFSGDCDSSGEVAVDLDRTAHCTITVER